MKKGPYIHVRVGPKALPLLARLKKASEGLYAPTMSEIVMRGIDLALAELEKKRKS